MLVVWLHFLPSCAVYSMFVAMSLFANCLINCLMLGGNVIECVNSYKILGVIIMDEDLKWNSHVKYFSKKACKKVIFAQSTAYCVEVCQDSILKIYPSTVRPVLENVAPVWQAIPAYLSDAIERVRKRALYIICAESESYVLALQLRELDSLDNRRDDLCNRYMTQMKSPSHPLHHLLPCPLLNEPKYNLRHDLNKYLFTNTIACTTKRAENFFMFRYFN